MTALYSDDYMKRIGFKNTEEYLKFCKEENIPAHFEGEQYFISIFENNIILPYFTIIRTMYNLGGQDGFYHATETGELLGAGAGIYSGKEGLHKPKDILSIEEAPRGWDLDKFRLNSEGKISRIGIDKLIERL